ncbi:alpha/beta hydrolase [Streptomyces sp. NPDC059850]|uniref:alpha/beta hydrolase n=1 Tax=Streptomyces sp. NPDC059850 TaxID=3346970 RepID=UPI0036511B2C
MRFTSEHRLDDGVVEREFTLGETPGTLWTPGSAGSSGAAPALLILMAHNNGLPKGAARLVARARLCAAYGYAVVTIDAAGCGDRPRSAADEQVRADLRRAMRAGEPVDEIFESLVGPLVEGAVPEWRTTLDAVLALPGIGGPVGYSGWTALGIRLAVVEPRIAAAGFFAGGYVPRAQREEARQVGGREPVLRPPPEVTPGRQTVMAQAPWCGPGPSVARTVTARPRSCGPDRTGTAPAPRGTRRAASGG